MEDRRDTGRSKVLKDLDETLNLSRLDTNRDVLVKTAGIFRDVEQIIGFGAHLLGSLLL